MSEKIMEESFTNGNYEKKKTLDKEYDFDNVGEFYFESDHLALKGNPDYHLMLKTVAILEAQKLQAIQDLDKLLECQEKALTDPIEFVTKLQKNEISDIPKPQKIVDIPDIDWNQYTLTNSQFFLEKRQLTRKSLKDTINEDHKTPSIDNSGNLVRGRICNETKPSTFNQLWTNEEQKRLEMLLMEYPPEEVESKRWVKIAAALGNRTPTQVASRVQKYFIKLARAGLPIPGRNPNKHSTRRVYPRRNALSKYFLYTSTFLASHIPPVFMNEAEDETNVNNYSLSSSLDGDASSSLMDFGSDDEGIAEEMKDTPEYRELLHLKQIKKEKLATRGLAQHVGYSCNRCNVEPIIGTRWHCTECPKDESVNFCSDCVDCMHECNNHTSDHKLESIKQAEHQNRHLDSDYMHFLTRDNYLDSNFRPAL